MCDILLPHTGSFVIFYATYLDCKKIVWHESVGDIKLAERFAVYIILTSELRILQIIMLMFFLSIHVYLVTT